MITTTNEFFGNNITLRLNMKQVCHLLGCSRDMIHKYIREDPLFPKPLKQGTTRQAPVFFDTQEIVDWYKGWKEQVRTNDQNILVA